MRAHQKMFTKLMLLIVSSALCGLPEVAQAQQSSQSQMQQQQNGTTINPSEGPLQPVPQNEPSTESAPNPESETQAIPATPAPQPRPEQQMQQPLGAATAEGVPTVGGAASRPAGEAIAPDKQRDRHSLLIKVGLIAAAGIAVGTVYGLSKGTSSTPK
jgi:hypothetical protein